MPQGYARDMKYMLMFKLHLSIMAEKSHYLKGKFLHNSLVRNNK